MNALKNIVEKVDRPWQNKYRKKGTPNENPRGLHTNECPYMQGAKTTRQRVHARRKNFHQALFQTE